MIKNSEMLLVNIAREDADLVTGCEPFPLGLLADDRLPWFIGQFRSLYRVVP